jgi:PAS domain S-box-containing protein
MKVRGKIVAVMALSAVSLITAVFGVIGVFMYRDALRSDRLLTEQRLDTLAMGIRARIRNLGTTATDYASWDDTFAYIQDPYPEYISSNFTPETFLNNQLDSVLLVDIAREIVFDMTLDRASGARLPTDPALRRLVENGVALSDFWNKDAKLDGFLVGGGGPMLVAARPILSSHFAGPPRGVLIFTRKSGPEFVAELARDLDLDLVAEALPPSGDRNALSPPAPEAAPTITVETVDSRRLGGTLLFADVTGRPAVKFSITVPRLFYRQFLATYALLAVALLAIGVVINLLVVHLLDRMVLRRLFRLRDHMTSLSTPPRHMTRIPSLGTDEIGELADSVNEMLDAVEGAARARRAAEEAIRAGNERYRIATETTGQLVYDYEIASGRITWAGAIEQITGYPPDVFQKLGEEGWERKIHPDDQAAVRERLAESISKHKAFYAEYRFAKADGEWIHVEDTGVIILGADGSTARMIGSMKDVSAQVRAADERAWIEEELRQTQKMESLGRLAGGIAHDFNNLLTSIMGNIQLAMMKAPDQEKRSPFLPAAFASAESAASLTAQLLAFSRKQVIEPQVIDLNRQIETMHKILIRLIREDITLSMLLEAQGKVRVDPGLMGQVLVNLVVNARDAMPAGGALTIETADVRLERDFHRHHDQVPPGHYVKLTVSDSGEGMDRSVLEHLFEPFFTTKPMGKGTGLGLATTYGTVRQSGGIIDVKSAIGRGSSFHVYLPSVSGDTEIAPEGPRMEQLPGGNERIILVEDEPSVANLAATVLESLGYRVRMYSSGEELLQEPGGIPEAELLLTDVIMPGMNGRELARRVDSTAPGMAVLFTSGYTDDVIIHHGLLEEGINFLPKPYTPATLAAKIRAVLDARRSG